MKYFRKNPYNANNKGMCLMRKEMSLAVLCPSDSSSLEKKKGV